MLAALKEAIPMIRTHEGVEIELAHLPPDDPEVYAMLRRADTVRRFPDRESRANGDPAADEAGAILRSGG